MREKQLVKNTGSLFIFNLAKILFPFITLPYLTRVMTTESYGVVAYVKTVMTYIQIIVDFGFILSATKDIVNTNNDEEKRNIVIGDTLLAKMILGLAAGIALGVLSYILPILSKNMVYTFLSYLVVFASIFFMDFVFRGMEIMHVIMIRFLFMKVISTLLTFLFVKGDADILMIPFFDLVSSVVAICLVLYEMKKRGIKIRFSGLSRSLGLIKESFIFFLSNVASTSFNALSTLIIGIKISATEVAYWSVCMQIITAVQACYTPISDGIYPTMIKNQDIGMIKKVIRYVLPVVFVGCIIAYFLANYAMLILGGSEYLVAVPVFRLLIPVLFFGFLSIIFGWPTLGAIGKTRETTISTVVSVSIYIILLVFLLAVDSFTLRNIAIVRTITEVCLFNIRLYFYRKYKYLFKGRNQCVKLN